MTPPKSSALREHVRLRLINRPRPVTLAEVARDTGLTTHWLETLIADKSPDCSVLKCEVLYTYFEGKQLTL